MFGVLDPEELQALVGATEGASSKASLASGSERSGSVAGEGDSRGRGQSNDSRVGGRDAHSGGAGDLEGPVRRGGRSRQPSAKLKEQFEQDASQDMETDEGGDGASVATFATEGAASTAGHSSASSTRGRVTAADSSAVVLDDDPAPAPRRAAPLHPPVPSDLTQVGL